VINRVFKALHARTRPSRAPTSCISAQAVNEAASRAERIGEFWGAPEDTRLGELLIDLEEDKGARAVVFGLLAEMSCSSEI
jgi:hypothetical protein